MLRLPALLLIGLLGTFPAARGEDAPTAPKAKGKASQGLLNKLLAPGPLLHGHSKLEGTDCLKCHVPGEGIPDSKCLDCHKELKPQVAGKTGFHGLSGKRCVDCHDDHKGRDHDTTVVQESSFDHSRTGYRLEGKHATLACDKCHLERRAKANKAVRPEGLRYFGLKTSCKGCHDKHDPHRFPKSLKSKFAAKDCDACHGMKSWKTELRFDHAKDAGYPLAGKHAQAKCAKCHIDKRNQPVYAWPRLKEARCLSCHENKHKPGSLSPRFMTGRCEQCHLQDSWKLPKFDHAVTGLPLRGKHAAIQCNQCHKQLPNWTGLRRDCISCHKAKDRHLFGPFRSARLKRPNDCQGCHTESNWKEIHDFNHNRDTRMPLGGKHIGVACEKCHIPDPATPSVRIYQWKNLEERNCELCHKSPHRNAFSKELLAKRCTDCHMDTSWSQLITGGPNFSHDKGTRFPLTGKHRQVTCKQCHGSGIKQQYRFPSHEKSFCVDCHKNVHRQQFSERYNDKSCADCHSTDTFRVRLAGFKHEATRFPLTGRHATLDCAQCHKASAAAPGQPVLMLETKPPRPMARFVFEEGARQGFCTECHRNVHLEQFTPATARKACSACHTTADFTRRKEFNHSETPLPLRGKHAEVKCEKCHVPTRDLFPPLKPGQSPHLKARFRFPELGARDCGTCHTKDPHKGSFGSKCSECHNETHWKKTLDFHRNFSLRGVHFTLECQECHKDGRRLGGMSQHCVLCHQKDDIHKGMLPGCGDCHQQQFWENSDFKHALSRFPLRGVHRTLDCTACHASGVYKGTPSRCVDCHLADAQGATLPHAALLGRNCAECHNQFSFEGAR